MLRLGGSGCWACQIDPSAVEGCRSCGLLVIAAGDEVVRSDGVPVVEEACG